MDTTRPWHLIAGRGAVLSETPAAFPVPAAPGAFVALFIRPGAVAVPACGWSAESGRVHGVIVLLLSTGPSFARIKFI